MQHLEWGLQACNTNPAPVPATEIARMCRTVAFFSLRFD